MEEKRYEYRRGKDVFNYEFESEGPKGIVRKGIRFNLMAGSPLKVYNVGFGDWDTECNDLNDSAITNNADKQEVLSTVAAAILEFIEVHPDAFIYAEGNTPSRTRLYQMAISSSYSDISKLFVIIGRNKGRWCPFSKGVNYDAFLAWKK